MKMKIIKEYQEFNNEDNRSPIKQAISSVFWNELIKSQKDMLEQLGHGSNEFQDFIYYAQTFVKVLDSNEIKSWSRGISKFKSVAQLQQSMKNTLLRHFLHENGMGFSQWTDEVIAKRKSNQ